MSEAFFVVGQRFALGLGCEGENGQAEEKDQAHGYAGIAHGFGVASVDFAGEEAENGGAGCSDEAANVIAEGGSSAPEMSGEQFWKVDGVSSEE